MNTNSQQQLQSHLRLSTARSHAGPILFAQSPREPLRGLFYASYFYFYFMNTMPFQAAGSVMPG